MSDSSLADCDRWDAAQLRQALREKNLNSQGSKKQLVKRLLDSNRTEEKMVSDVEEKKQGASKMIKLSFQVEGDAFFCRYSLHYLRTGHSKMVSASAISSPAFRL